MKTVKIGLLGLGTVGGGVYKLIERQKSEMVSKTGADVEIAKILVHNRNKKREGIDESLLTDQWKDIIEDKEIDIENLETKEMKKEVRYIRTKRLNPKDIKELDGACMQEADGSMARVYTSKDFGNIKSDDELRLFCNKQIAKDKTHTPQKDQAETVDARKVK